MSTLQLPRIGLGTWQLSPQDCRVSVVKAIELGYRFIDTAQIYRNEDGVGDAIKTALDAGLVKREELVVSTKIWIWNLGPDKVLSSCDQSLARLGLDHVELLHVHWPAWPYKAEKTLGAFSELVDAGKVKNICVSNFTVALLEEAIETCDKPVFANQVEHHPMLQQRALREYMDEHGIKLIAYSPLARGAVLTEPALLKVAEKHGVSPTRVSLAWIMAHGAIPIPKATSESHLKDNFAALELALEPSNIELINEEITRERRMVNPPVIHPKWD